MPPRRTLGYLVRRALEDGPSKLRESLLRLVLGRDYAALQVGRVRLGGEIHLAMYDHISIEAALVKAGFVDIVFQSAITSVILGWSDQCLDTESDGSVYKPDSLFAL